MAIDPSIITNGVAAIGRQFDPAIQQEAAMRKQQLANAVQQNQLGAEQLTSAKAQNVAAAKQADDLQKAQDVLSQGLDSDATYQKLLTFNPKMADDYRKSQHQKIVDGLADQKAKLENAKSTAQQLGNLLGPSFLALQRGDTQGAAAAYAGARATAIQQRLIKPEDAPEQFDPTFVTTHFNGAIDAHQQVSNQLKQTDIEHQAAQDLFANKYKLATLGETQQQHGIENARNAANDQFNQKAKIAELSQGAERVSLEKQKANQLTQLGEDPTANMSGAEKQYWTKVAFGKAAPPNSRGNPDKAAKVGAIASFLNPDYQDSLYQNRKNFDADLAKDGKRGQVIDRVGTAVEHFDKFFADSANSGTMINPLSAANKATGADAKLLTGEINQAVKGGVATVEETKDILNDLKSPFRGTREAAAQAYATLLGGKMQQIARDYTVTHPGEQFPAEKYFGKRGVASMQKYGILNGTEASNTSVAAGATGATHRFNQATGKIETIQ
jgi:hypothetical protein